MAESLVNYDCLHMRTPIYGCAPTPCTKEELPPAPKLRTAAKTAIGRTPTWLAAKIQRHITSFPLDAPCGTGWRRPAALLPARSKCFILQNKLRNSIFQKMHSNKSMHACLHVCIYLSMYTCIQVYINITKHMNRRKKGWNHANKDPPPPVRRKERTKIGGGREALRYRTWLVVQKDLPPLLLPRTGGPGGTPRTPRCDATWWPYSSGQLQRIDKPCALAPPVCRDLVVAAALPPARSKSFTLTKCRQTKEELPPAPKHPKQRSAAKTAIGRTPTWLAAKIQRTPTAAKDQRM